MSDRTERLAVSVIDLDYMDPAFRRKIVTGRLNLAEPIVFDERGNKLAAVAFSCDLLTAALACDIIRNENRRDGDYPTRVFIWRETGWSKLPINAVLTLLDSNKQPFLNPEWFPVEVLPEDLVPPALEPVKLGDG